MIKPITINLAQDVDEAHIYALADLHLGDTGCNWQRIKAALDRIDADPHALVVLSGDLINNATKSSVSDIYAERLSPMEQITRCTDILRPIKDRVICCVPGNHEERTYRQDGVDITRLVARELGFEDRFRSDFAVIYVRLGRNTTHGNGRQHSYSIYVNHGNGGGRKIGGKANRLNDLAMVCDADIFIVGHTHTPMMFKDSFIRLAPNTDGAVLVERTYINTTAWLEYGGYGARQAYTPAAISCPVITLGGTRKHVSVEI